MLEDVAVLWFAADVPDDLSPPAVGGPLTADRRVRCHGWPEGARQHLCLGQDQWSAEKILGGGPRRKQGRRLPDPARLQWIACLRGPAKRDRGDGCRRRTESRPSPVLHRPLRSSSEPPKLEAMERPPHQLPQLIEPYKGLATFRERDARNFFGRATFTEEPGQAHRHAPGDPRRRRVRQRQVVGGFRRTDLEAEPRRRLGYRRLSASRDAAEKADARTGDAADSR